MERAFPRGGVKPVIKKKQTGLSFNIFKKKKKSKQKEKTTVKLSEQLKPSPIINPLELVNVDILNHSTIKEGMLVLGRIFDIRDFGLIISLPGNMNGLVRLKDISQQLANVASSEDISEDDIEDLSKFFEVGQFVTAKVIELPRENKSQVFLTLDPKETNSKLVHSLMKVGIICTGCITSVEEYGYLVSFGINRLTSFLPFSSTPSEKIMYPGQLVKCVVKSSTYCGPSSTSVQLSSLEEDLNDAVVNKQSKITFNSFLPGQKFEVVVKQQLKNGLKVSYLNEQIGYIHENHLVKPMDALQDYKPGKTMVATLLFIIPTVNTVFFTLIPTDEIQFRHKVGDIIKSRVKKVTNKGLVFLVGKQPSQVKCFVPKMRLPNRPNFTVTEEDVDMQSLYNVGSKQKMRILFCNLMERQYTATMEKSILTQKYYLMNDVNSGDIIKDAKVSEIFATGILLQISPTVDICVQKEFLSSTTRNHHETKIKIGQVMEVMVLKVIQGRRRAYGTTNQKLIKAKDRILKSYEEAECGACYVGTVIHITNYSILVLFMNNVKGLVPKNYTPYHQSDTLTENYTVGQVVECYVVQMVPETEKLRLSLVETYGANNPALSTFKIGHRYSVQVTSVNKNGLTVQCPTENGVFIGRIPSYLLTDYRSLANLLSLMYNVGDTLEAYACLDVSSMNLQPCFTTSASLKKVFQQLEDENLSELRQEDKVLPYIIQYVDLKKQKLYLWNVLGSFNEVSNIVHSEHLSDHSINMTDLNFRKYQIVFGRIIGKIGETGLRISTQLSRCWNKNYKTSLQLLNGYLSEYSKIKSSKIVSVLPVSNYTIGQRVKTVISLCLEKSVRTKLQGSVTGVIQTDDVYLYSPEDEVEAVVVWIDYVQQKVYLSRAFDTPLKHAGPDHKIFSGTRKSSYRCKILAVTQDLVVGMLKGQYKGLLVYLPRRRHINDFEPPSTHYSIGTVYKIHLERSGYDHLLGIDLGVYKGKRKRGRGDFGSGLKELDLGKSSKRFKLEPDVKMTNGEENNVSVKSRAETLDVTSEGGSDIEDLQSDDNNEKITFSSSSSEDEVAEECMTETADLGFNWNVMSNPALLSNVNKDESDSSSDSSDEEETESKEKKKSKRLSKAEKLEKARMEEDRIRKVEEKLMEFDKNPQSADDFDRLVMSRPDDSALWLRYMAFHLQATEIEKARSIGRKALKTISFREEQEKLNVWVALLNLENLYGNEESLNKTLDEAVQYNEPYKVHLQMLNIYSESSKLNELEKLGNFMVRKYKENDDVWHEVGSVLMKAGKVEAARNVLQKALTVLEKKKHVELICKFAQLENRLGNQERAQTLYEHILTSFPKRVDVWSSYVDMLVKSDNIDLARQVLERATSQTLPARKMKTLFKKFLSFEEEQGTPENVEKVREAAVAYVKSAVSDDEDN